MQQQQTEDLEQKLTQAYETIRWLEQEVLRLKMLLAGKDVMMNSLSNQKTVD